MDNGSDDDFEALLERSSLGTPGAQNLRRRTPHSQVESIRRIAELRNTMVHAASASSERRAAATALASLLENLGYHDRAKQLRLEEQLPRSTASDTTFPVLKMTPLSPVPSRFLQPTRRQLSDLPTLVEGSVLVFQTDERYALAPAGPKMLASEVVVKATMVAVIAVRAQEVTAVVELPSAKRGTHLTLHAIYNCRVFDPVQVMESGCWDVRTDLRNYLLRDSKLRSLAAQEGAAENPEVTQRILGRMHARNQLEPPVVPGIRIELVNIALNIKNDNQRAAGNTTYSGTEPQITDGDLIVVDAPGDIDEFAGFTPVRPPRSTNARSTGAMVAGAIAADLIARSNVRQAARTGRLPEYMETATTAERAALYKIVALPVYERLPRGIEPDTDSHDRYQDEVAAVLDDLLRNGTGHIGNIEGWIVSRLNRATVDVYRRRRGERGAQQRPRLPGWLTDALDHDPWLEVLAIEILTWVGVTATAGVGLWPLVAWADRRAAVTGQPAGTGADVANDVERVLAAMRTNRIWYERYVERLLGRKQAPVLPVRCGEPDQEREHPHMALTEPYEARDAHLRELAATAVAAIETRVGRGEDVRTVVVDMLDVLFGAGTGAEDMDRVPDPGTTPDERVAALLDDPATVERIVTVVRDILTDR